MRRRNDSAASASAQAPESAAPGRTQRGIQSVEVGGRLLRALADARAPLGATDLATSGDIPSSQAHAYLVSLTRLGLIKRDALSGRYEPGPLALRLGLLHLAQQPALREAVPRAGNASGGGQPGWILKCKGWETDPNAYIYFIAQAPVWDRICKLIGREEWIDDPDYATPNARLPRLKEIFAEVERWTMTKTKFEAMEILNRYDIPCGPILSMKEIAEDESLRKTGTIVEVDHPVRGRYLTVGNPIKLSDSPTEVTRSPLLGEHTDEVMAELGYSREQIEALRTVGAI